MMITCLALEEIFANEIVEIKEDLTIKKLTGRKIEKLELYLENKLGIATENAKKNELIDVLLGGVNIYERIIT